MKEALFSSTTSHRQIVVVFNGGFSVRSGKPRIRSFFGQLSGRPEGRSTAVFGCREKYPNFCFGVTTANKRLVMCFGTQSQRVLDVPVGHPCKVELAVLGAYPSPFELEAPWFGAVYDTKTVGVLRVSVSSSCEMHAELHRVVLIRSLPLAGRGLVRDPRQGFERERGRRGRHRPAADLGLAHPQLDAIHGRKGGPVQVGARP